MFLKESTRLYSVSKLICNSKVLFFTHFPCNLEKRAVIAFQFSCKLSEVIIYSDKSLSLCFGLPTYCTRWHLVRTDFVPMNWLWTAFRDKLRRHVCTCSSRKDLNGIFLSLVARPKQVKLNMSWYIINWSILHQYILYMYLGRWFKTCKHVIVVLTISWTMA